MIRLKQVKVIHHGSRITETIFKNEKKQQVKIRVYFNSYVTCANNSTHYTWDLSVKEFRSRCFKDVFTSKTPMDINHKAYITTEQLYKALHNHWIKHDPFRLLSTGQINSDLTFNDEIEQFKHVTNHKAY